MRCMLALGMWLLTWVAPSPALAQVDRWVDIVAPGERERVRGASWVEVRGRARERMRDVAYDIVIALDLSESSFRPAGFDVDGDGVTGQLVETAIPSLRLTDRHDSVAHAGVEVARRFLRHVDPARGRVALVTFAGHPRVRAELGPAYVTAGTLDGLGLYPQRSGTDLASVVRRAVALLDAQPPLEDTRPRQRTLLLVSDGHPTAPGSRRAAARYARRAAAEAGRAGVRIFGVSPERTRWPVSPVLIDMAKLSGGETFRSDLAQEWLRRLEPTRPLEIRSVSLRNTRTDQPGRALRWFEDGSFDGYVQLLRGTNTLEARVELVDGEVLERALVVRYRPGPGAGQTLLQALRRRTVETELASEARGAAPPAERHRSVEVRPE